MVRSWIEIRKTRGAVCALALGCVLFPAASARQSSTGDAAAQKAAPAKKTSSGKTNSPKHRSATAGTTVSSSKTRTASASSRKRYSKKKSARARGQQKIDGERAQAIQEALIREHYLSGEATGTWNQASEEAMRRYQEDNGWQSKEVPDSRALIKLGLGPSKDHLLNPESAMTTVPDVSKPESMSTASHSAPVATDPAPAPKPTQSDSSGPQ